MHKNIIKIGLVVFLFGLLIGIRYFETLFYDPLQLFFKEAYLHQAIPELNLPTLFVNLFIRYFLNSFISILLIWIIFNEKSFVTFSSYFFIIAFIILLVSFYLLLQTGSSSYYSALFYVRRFLIQPIFVLLLLPAFYYQKMQN